MHKIKHLRLGILLILIFAGYLLTQTIWILAPGPGNDEWIRGTKHFIKWEPTGPTGDLRIILRRNNQQIGIIKETYTPAGGPQEMYHWTVGDIVGGKAPVGSNYKIRLKIKGKSDFTDSIPFTIKGPLQR